MSGISGGRGICHNKVFVTFVTDEYSGVASHLKHETWKPWNNTSIASIIKLQLLWSPIHFHSKNCH